MEYLVGSVSTIITILIVLFVVSKVINARSRSTKIFYSQSNIYERIKPAIPFMPPKPRESQSTNYQRQQMLRVAIIDNLAYWISDNAVFVANINEDGFIDKESARPIDTMGMDKVELDKIGFIVERLTEGNNNDSGNTRHQGF